MTGLRSGALAVAGGERQRVPGNPMPRRASAMHLVAVLAPVLLVLLVMPEHACGLVHGDPLALHARMRHRLR